MPFEFFIEWLYPLHLRHKKMFGIDAFYLEERIVFALCKNEKYHKDYGIWIATKKEHHQKLKHQLTSIRPLISIGIKTWLVLPENHDAFEEDAHTLVTLLKSGSPLIGNIPKKRKP
ncbi:hypothetical protein GCM10011344_01520 [Dokdonia pacifica]|uniref:Uncharacterized protein n=1 Tax=Dokdonia pacifica TaxID=1627892 RepID=A0A238Z7B9_9FLAO|nr:hypothetical protein [Dokdonia pacifica]GGG04851.1 hypothetical protein GCM10011344_01520 [Dokdonia pacifica]SNR79355.1 hypothetical protein SAMN06265376_10312 [Dokdonia pacifica]